MKTILILLLISILLVSGCVQENQDSASAEKRNLEPKENTNIEDQNKEASSQEPTGQSMKLTSPEFENGGQIPSNYTCDGFNVSPPLNFENVPKNAKSLVLIVDDPDAIKPAGKVWDHWVAFNIPPQTKSVEEGRDPEGVMGINSRNNLTYGGPCPPDGEHRYYFRLYALDTMLKLKEGATKADVLKAIEGHVIEQAELMGKYKRV